MYSFRPRPGDDRGDLGPPPPPFRVGQPRETGQASRRFLIGLVGLLVAIVILGAIGVGFYAEWLWFESLGYLQLFTTVLFTRVGLFVVGAVVFFVVAAANLFLARRLGPRRRDLFAVGGTTVEVRRLFFWVALGVAGLGAILFGLIAGGNWETWLRYQKGVPFGIADPIFGEDAAFYVFTLPFYRSLQTWGRDALVVTLLFSAGYYAFMGLDLEAMQFRFPDRPSIYGHLSVLGAIILLFFAASYWLGIYDLVYSTRGVVYGVSFTDYNAQIMALRLLMGIALIVAVLLAANVVLQRVTWPAVALGIWLVASILLSTIYPAVVQRLQVVPNELEKETPYIANNIRMTRFAFGLDKVEDKFFPAEDSPTPADIRANPETVQNIRLWDHRPLKDTLNQIQSIRLYYDFNDVDIDRYTIDGQYRQVMLSAREMVKEKLTATAQTWVNQRLQFTHGYGVTVIPVTEFNPEGLPILLVKDVPPTGVIPISRPEIYYGEKSNDVVIVNTSELEFDYPKGDENVFTRYQGKDGIVLDSYLKRLTFASVFRDINLVLSGQLTGESKLLWRRNIQERVRAIAPFLRLDRDPYIVIANGQLYWIQDAYTVTSRFPNSQPYQRSFNYIRNSVKVVINAYDGETHFYIADPDDALVQTYAAIFPGTFIPLEEMPASLRAHVRYPEDLFAIQSEMYLTYHMEDPRVFYNKEDLWVFPKEVYAGAEQTMAPYFVIMRLPGEAKAEFVQILPFTPVAKDNAIAWLAARSDGEHYGKLFSYKFPKEKLIFGPNQIESRISQEPLISQQITLWGQVGSRVIRGNLLMIPIGQSLLYSEPLYLQAEKSQIPELKRVILSDGKRVVMEPTLDAALASLFGAAPPTKPPPGEQPPPTELPKDVASLVKAAQAQYTKGQAALKAGDWAGYGAAQKELEGILNRLVQIAGS